MLSIHCRRWQALGGLLIGLLVLAGCSKKADESPPPAATATTPPASAVAPATPAPSLPTPDVGKIENTTIKATGYGKTASEAVAEAMRLAILQVNGAALDMETVNVNYGVAALLGQTALSMKAAAFGEAVSQRSGGLIQNFKILELQEPAESGLTDKLLKTEKAGQYKATIEAAISKFTPSADLKKIRLVVAPLRFDRASIPMGDRSVPAKEVGAQLRQRIQQALLDTGRFAILDRELNSDIDNELDMIAQGDAPKAEVAKLSQAVTADLIWIGKINNLAYNKHSRQLMTSDRQLVSYSGGWSINQKLVNVATRQVMTADILRGAAPSTAPTTLGRGVNSDKMLGGMSDDLVNQVVASILAKTFPVAVVSRNGANVVLSQGGKSLAAGGRYAVVALGDEMKDPQTGQSLGRAETPCCEVVVDRVTPNLSYGRLENITGSLDALKPGSLLVRERLKDAPKEVAAATATSAQGQPGAKSKGKKSARKDDGDLEPDAPPDHSDKW